MGDASESIRTIPLPTPYPVGRVNAYLLRGRGPTTLVDAGVRSSKSIAELEAGLEAAGARLEEVEQVLVTHGHFDHAGAAPDLAERARARIRCHGDAARRETVGRGAFLDLLVRFGAPTAMRAQLEAAWRWGDRFGRPLAESDAVDLVGDGEVVRAGDLELEALHTPGHAPGHLCFLSRAEGLLFCGDLLLAHITPNPLPHMDPQAPRGRRPTLGFYLASLARVEALGSCRGLPGHDVPLDDTVEAVRVARSHVLGRSDGVLDLMAANPGKTINDLADLLFGEGNPLGQALAFCELLAHADRLEDEGRIALDPETGVPSVLA